MTDVWKQSLYSCRSILQTSIQKYVWIIENVIESLDLVQWEIYFLLQITVFTFLINSYATVVKTLKRSIVIFWVKVLKAIFLKVKVHRSKFGSFVPFFEIPKGFHYQKAIFRNLLSTVPLTWVNWSRNFLP